MPNESSPPNDPRLDRVVADYLKQVEEGHRPSQDELLKAHPDLADSLKAFFADHQRMQDLAAPAAASSLDDATLPRSNPADEDATLPPLDRRDTGDEATIPPSSRGNAPPVGTRVRYFGDYELLEEIARGGMGVVYKARQTKLNRIVALKMILSGQLAGEEDVRRFHAEAEAAAQLDHQGIVPIFEVGEHEGQHYFSMAFVDGGSLADKIKDGPLPPREAAEYVKKVSEAVAYAHSKGVIHRDLKPGNILLDPNGEPKVTDFGLAKRVEGDSGLTATGQILGTPSYMPPEQASGKTDEVTEAADVYSLGAILYALVTGRPPFQADNPIDTLIQVLEREPLSPTQLVSTLPRDLETICLKCMRKVSGERYSTATAFAADLALWLENKPILAKPVGAMERARKWAQRRPAAATLVFVVTAPLVYVATEYIGGEASDQLPTGVSFIVATYPMCLLTLGAISGIKKHSAVRSGAGGLALGMMISAIMGILVILFAGSYRLLPSRLPRNLPEPLNVSFLREALRVASATALCATALGGMLAIQSGEPVITIRKSVGWGLLCGAFAGSQWVSLLSEFGGPAIASGGIALMTAGILGLGTSFLWRMNRTHSRDWLARGLRDGAILGVPFAALVSSAVLITTPASLNVPLIIAFSLPVSDQLGSHRHLNDPRRTGGWKLTYEFDLESTSPEEILRVIEARISTLERPKIRIEEVEDGRFDVLVSRRHPGGVEAAKSLFEWQGRLSVRILPMRSTDYSGLSASVFTIRTGDIQSAIQKLEDEQFAFDDFAWIQLYDANARASIEREDEKIVVHNGFVLTKLLDDIAPIDETMLANTRSLDDDTLCLEFTSIGQARFHDILRQGAASFGVELDQRLFVTDFDLASSDLIVHTPTGTDGIAIALCNEPLPSQLKLRDEVRISPRHASQY